MCLHHMIGSTFVLLCPSDVLVYIVLYLVMFCTMFVIAPIILSPIINALIYYNSIHNYNLNCCLKMIYLDYLYKSISVSGPMEILYVMLGLCYWKLITYCCTTSIYIND